MSKDSEIGALPCTPAVAFRDNAFRSRTVVFPDGDTAVVHQSVVTVSMPEHVAFLNHHADFERADKSA